MASPRVRLPVPSAGLLRFLRRQSELLFPAEASGFVLLSARHNERQRRLSSPMGWPLAATCCGVSGPRPWGRPTTRATFSTSRPARMRWRQLFRKPAAGAYTSAPWYDRLWGWRWGGLGPGGSGRAGLLPGDLPDPAANAEFASVMFNARRLQTAKAALEPRLRCTEVDEKGEVILADGEFKKTELIAKYGLLPRDLRKIDSSNLPHILVRPAAILLNLLHLKVLIKSDRVLLFDVYGSKTSYPQSAFMYDLQQRLHQKTSSSSVTGSNSGTNTGSSSVAGSNSTNTGSSSVAGSNSTNTGAGTGASSVQTTPGLPYEFRALEAVLLSVTSELEADFDTVREPVIRILSELEQDITRDQLRVLLVLSKKVSTFEQKAKLVRDAIEELLEADDDLTAMYLTEKKHGLFRGEDDHTEVEMLLESYHKICDEVAQEAGSLVTSIRNTEEIIRAILDANRNALMLLDLKFSIGTLGLAMGTFLAGLYGMNLENFIEDTHWGFGSVTTASFAFSLLVCWYGLVKLRKVQRVKMHGSSSSSISGLGSLGGGHSGMGAAAATGANGGDALFGSGLGLGSGLTPTGYLSGLADPLTILPPAGGISGSSSSVGGIGSGGGSIAAKAAAAAAARAAASASASAAAAASASNSAGHSAAAGGHVRDVRLRRLGVREARRRFY